MIKVAAIRGNDELFSLTHALGMDYTWRISFTDSKFSDIDVNSMESSGNIGFWDCKIRDVCIVESRLGEIKVHPGTSIDNLYIRNVEFDNLSSSGLVLTNSYVRGVNFGINLFNNMFAKFDNCEFVNLKMFGGGARIFGDIQNSKISGKLHGVKFWENEDHTQCQNLDLSEVLVPQCSFTGVDMRRIKCKSE